MTLKENLKNLWHIRPEPSRGIIRFLALMGLILFPAWFFFMKFSNENNFDWFWARSLVVLPLLFTLVTIQSSRFSTRTYLWIQVFVESALALFHDYLLHVNHANSDYLISSVLMYGALIAIINDMKEFVVFTSAVLFGSIVVMVMDDYSMPTVLHFACALLTLITGFAGIYYRLRIYESSESRRIIIEEQIAELKATRAKIAQSEKLASLGEMAGGIAHEINNPLSIIAGHTSILGVELKALVPNEEKILYRVEKIRSTTERIAIIVKGLRSFARDGSELPIEPISVQEVLTTVLELCNEKFKSSGIAITIDGNTDLIVNCRSVQTTQIIFNLLGNSFHEIKSSPERWITISVSEKNRMAFIRITDSGNGIPEKIQERLFQPFFTTKSVGEGTGLGLSISRGLAQDQGGDLTYELYKNHTSFLLKIPIA